MQISPNGGIISVTVTSPGDEFDERYGAALIPIMLQPRV